MAIFSVNDDGEFELSEESKWVRDNHEFRSLSEKEIKLIFDTAKKDSAGDSLWVYNACDAYFKLKDFFKSCMGVSVELVAFEIGADEQKYIHSLSVHARGIKAIDIYAGSVLAECISVSSGFQVSDGKSLDFEGLRIIFDRKAGRSHRIPMDDELWLDESVDEFDKMKFYDSLGDLVAGSPELDEFFEDGSFFGAVEEAVDEWCRENNCYMPLPYDNMIGSLCRLIGHMVITDIDCPPDYDVLCNSGGIRINIKCSFVDPIDVELCLPIILKIVSNIHFEWGIEDEARKIEEGDSEDEVCRNKYDISFDMPVKWQYSK